MRIDPVPERYRSPINGVVKADQLDAFSVWQELDEFVVTRELNQHLRTFFSAYGEALDHRQQPHRAGNIGVWVSGFFGSGKSHFLKVLSCAPQQQPHARGPDQAGGGVLQPRSRTPCCWVTSSVRWRRTPT